MGIQRLSQDLLPYAQIAVLGQNDGRGHTRTITQVVVDGPSLVYFVYNKLVRLAPPTSQTRK